MTKNTYCCEKCIQRGWRDRPDGETESAHLCGNPTCECHTLHSEHKQSANVNGVDAPDNWKKIEKEFDEKFGGTLEMVKANSGIIKHFLREKLSAHHALIRERVGGKRIAANDEITPPMYNAGWNTAIDVILSALDELKI